MTHYETLGVSEKATQEEIKSAYKDLIKKYHPDIYQGDKIFAEKKTKEINVAYDVLSNPETRKNYDEELHPQANSTYTSSNYEYTPPKYNNSNPYKKYYEDYKNKTAYNSNNYYRRYADYHRTKTPNSNYYTNDSNSISFIHEKIKYIIIILIIYFFVLVFTYLQLSSFLKDDKEKITTNKQESSNYINITTPSNSTKNNTFPNKEDVTSDEFNINDYFSDEELYNAYNNYFKNDFDSFSEFKEFFEKYVYEEYF
jgi:curved DNA-binding protein CbpA